MSTVEEIKEIIKKVDFSNIPLMEKPTAKKLSSDPYLYTSNLDNLSQRFVLVDILPRLKSV